MDPKVAWGQTSMPVQFRTVARELWGGSLRTERILFSVSSAREQLTGIEGRERHEIQERHDKCTIPRWMAAVAACVRSWTPNLLKMFLTWFFTVCSAMFSE